MRGFGIPLEIGELGLESTELALVSVGEIMRYYTVSSFLRKNGA